MMVPIPVIKLDEPHAALRQSPRQQAIRTERTIAGRATVGFAHRLRLIARFEQAGHARLHLKGHLILRNSGLDLRIVHLAVVLAVDRVNRVYQIALLFARNPWRVWQIMHRIAFGPNLDTLKLAWQKTG